MDELTERRANALKRQLIEACKEVFDRFGMEDREPTFIWLPDAIKFTVQASMPECMTISEQSKAAKVIMLPDGQGGFREVVKGDPVRINPSRRKVVEKEMENFEGVMDQIQRSKAFVVDPNGQRHLVRLEFLAAFPEVSNSTNGAVNEL